jgi:hypothetical protein
MPPPYRGGIAVPTPTWNFGVSIPQWRKREQVLSQRFVGFATSTFKSDIAKKWAQKLRAPAVHLKRPEMERIRGALDLDSISNLTGSTSLIEGNQPERKRIRALSGFLEELVA